MAGFVQVPSGAVFWFTVPLDLVPTGDPAHTSRRDSSSAPVGVAPIHRSAMGASAPCTSDSAAKSCARRASSCTSVAPAPVEVLDSTSFEDSVSAEGEEAPTPPPVVCLKVRPAGVGEGERGWGECTTGCCADVSGHFCLHRHPARHV